MDLPQAYVRGANPQTAERALPLKHAQIESLQDALHGERQTAAHLPAAGADFLLQLKDNQPKTSAQARKIAATQPPLFSFDSVESDHGRIDQRWVSVYPFDPLESDFPRVRGLIVVRKTSTAAADPEASILSFYLCRRLPNSASEAARLIRGHWGGCEIRNHWVRDALWGEDRTRSKHWKLNANLAILRAGLIALRAQCVPEPSWPVLFERCSHHPAIAFRLVTQPRFK